MYTEKGRNKRLNAVEIYKKKSNTCTCTYTDTQPTRSTHHFMPNGIKSLRVKNFSY